VGNRDNRASGRRGGTPAGAGEGAGAGMWVNAMRDGLKRRSRDRGIVTVDYCRRARFAPRMPGGPPRRGQIGGGSGAGRYRDLAILGPRVHISRSACVNGFRAVGLLLRSCITRLYNANATGGRARARARAGYRISQVAGGAGERGRAPDRPGSASAEGKARHVLVCKLKCK